MKFQDSERISFHFVIESLSDVLQLAFGSSNSSGFSQRVLVLRSVHFDAETARRTYTTTIRGLPSEVLLTEEDGMKARCAANLHNPVTVVQNRLDKRVVQLSSLRMDEICAALRFSLGCDVGS